MGFGETSQRFLEERGKLKQTFVKVDGCRALWVLSDISPAVRKTNNLFS